MKKTKCKTCGNLFDMGYTGTVDGCDICMDVQRDKEGNAWYPGEDFATYAPVATKNDKNTWFTVFRRDVMK